MKAGTHQDFGRSRARVAARFRDPERLERALTRAGLRMESRADGPMPAWHCHIDWRGAPQMFDLHLVEIAADQGMELRIASPLARGTLALDLADRPDGGCRVTARVALSPRTLAARVALQGARLARGRIEERLRRLLVAVVRD